MSHTSALVSVGERVRVVWVGDELGGLGAVVAIEPLEVVVQTTDGQIVPVHSAEL